MSVAPLYVTPYGNISARPAKWLSACCGDDNITSHHITSHHITSHHITTCSLPIVHPNAE